MNFFSYIRVVKIEAQAPFYFGLALYTDDNRHFCNFILGLN